MWETLTVFDYSRPSLRQCYDSIKGLVDPADSLEIVEEVERYRNLWRPETVRVVLLAESHVHTSKEDFLEWSYGKNPTYSGRLVRFVYCLGYGENLVKISSNPGTSQFWKILYSCLHRVPEKHAFAPILKSLTRDQDQRIANKILLLEQLKKAGVWLVDASIIGINGRDSDLKSRVVAESWDGYTGPLIERVDPRPRNIIVIGYGVAETLESRLKQLNIPTHKIPQPQGWRKPGYTQFYQECYEICSKFA
jgi:hypothetical protein